MDFRLTLFNGITLFVIALTAWMIFARFRFDATSRWFLLYYLVILGFSIGFRYSLNTAWICAGLAAALLLKWGLGGAILKSARVLELTFFGYVLWRGLALLEVW